MRSALRTPFAIYGLAILASLLLSWDGFLRGAVLNPDGICYLQSAATYANADFSIAMHLCGQAQWPFYSYLIYLFATLTKISYLDTAFFLNAVFSLISVVTFVYIARLLGGSQRVLGLAAIVILLAHEFNDVREYVIRDHGFWAFYLISFASFIQFLRTDKWIFALAWAVALTIATLFRIEGAIFLLFLPMSVFFQLHSPFPKNILRFIKLNGLLGVLLVAALIYSALHPSGVHVHRISELQAQLTGGLHTLVQHFTTTASLLGDKVLSVYAIHDERMLLFILLVAWLLVSVISNVTAIYAALFGYAVIKQVPQTDRAAKTAMHGYLFVSLLICAIFLAENLFLSKRYLIALSLILMMWVPFALDHLITLRKKAILMIVALLMLLTSLGGIFDFGYSKQYIVQAGNWLEHNTPATASIYSNDVQVMYYSQHFGNAIFAKEQLFLNPHADVVSKGKWKQFDFLALRFNKNEMANSDLIKEMALQPMISFSNKRGDQVIIYKVPHLENPS